MKVTIDLSGITSRRALHMILAAHLDLPPYYGRNLDALHDCLSEKQGDVELVLLNEEKATEHMRPYFSGMRKVLDDLAGRKKNIRAEWR